MSDTLSTMAGVSPIDADRELTDVPVVSVIVPAYNAASTVQRALDSLQHHAVPLEAIVVDDCSTDDTMGILQRLSCPGVRVMATNQNLGAAGARNAALAVARGKYVGFLDADDEWLPGKLEQQVNVLETHSDCSLVACDALRKQLDGTTWRHHAIVRPTEGAEAWKALLRSNFLPTPCVLARTDQVRRLGGFNASLPYSEDLDLWIRLGAEGSITVLSDVLAVIHERPGSLTKRFAHPDLFYTLPMIEGHLSRYADRLTGRERDIIRGTRYFGLGLEFFHNQDFPMAIRWFTASARHRHRLFKSGYFVVRSILNRSFS